MLGLLNICVLQSMCQTGGRRYDKTQLEVQLHYPAMKVAFCASNSNGVATRICRQNKA